VAKTPDIACLGRGDVVLMWQKNSSWRGSNLVLSISLDRSFDTLIIS
jgi:hypothetical protein